MAAVIILLSLRPLCMFTLGKVYSLDMGPKLHVNVVVVFFRNFDLVIGHGIGYGINQCVESLPLGIRKPKGVEQAAIICSISCSERGGKSSILGAPMMVAPPRGEIGGVDMRNQSGCVKERRSLPSVTPRGGGGVPRRRSTLVEHRH